MFCLCGKASKLASAAFGDGSGKAKRNRTRRFAGADRSGVAAAIGTDYLRRGDSLQPSRRSFFGGFAAGAVLSGALAASLLLTVFRTDQEQIIGDEAVSAHLRSLQAGHLTDVETSEQHTVKPWFNGKLDVAPPVIDLTAQGFTLVGGRLDEINGETTAAIVYRRRQHIINLFVSQRTDAQHGGETGEARRGFNVRH